MDEEGREKIPVLPHPGLRRVDFSGSQCGDKAFARLCGALQAMPVTQLIVAECGLSGRACEPLLAVLKAHREKRNQHHWSSTYVPSIQHSNHDALCNMCSAYKWGVEAPRWFVSEFALLVQSKLPLTCTLPIMCCLFFIVEFVGD